MTGKSAMRKMITEARSNHDGVMTDCPEIMNREVKGREGKGREEEGREEAPAPHPPRASFKKPELEDVKAFFSESLPSFDAEEFFNYWDSVDWKKKSGQRIVNWKAAARNYAKQPWAKKIETRNVFRSSICPICGVDNVWDHVCQNKDCPQYAEGER